MAGARRAEAGREYVAVVTYLPMKRALTLGRWARSIRSVQKQLDETAGLIGYSLRVNPFRLEFWTLSVWEDEERLRGFVNNVPHVDVTRRFGSKLPGFSVRQWTVSVQRRVAELARRAQLHLATL